MASIHRWSTSTVHPSKRLAFWNELCAGAYRPMVVDAKPHGFEGVLTRLCADELEITSVKSAPLIVRNAASDVAEIAAGLGVSARYLQMAFAEAGTTPSRFLLARRLDAAAARLRRIDRPCSVTDVALECGFSDLSYFSRVFRRRFGVTARAYRLSVGARSTDSP